MVVRLGTIGQMTLTLPLSLIVHFHINMTGGSVSFAQKWPPKISSEGDFLLLYFEYISEIVLG